MSATFSGVIDPDERRLLIGEAERQQAEHDAWIRYQVIVNGRIDILMKEVLHYQMTPFHMALAHFQHTRRTSLQLAFRGGGKSTVLTVGMTIYLITVDPNARICIYSKTAPHARSCLYEVKQHFEANEDYIRIFGDIVGDKWDESQIVVSTRTRPAKEPTVLCAGVDTQVVGKHFDTILGDDIVSEQNAKTPEARETVRIKVYKELHPTLEPDGRFHVIGTPYHFDDLYGHMQREDPDFQGNVQIIPSEDEYGRSPWPEKFSPVFFKRKKRSVGSIIYATQFLCNAEAMRGEVFQYDWFDFVDPTDVPDDLLGFGGIDLAIGEKEKHDHYASVGIGVSAVTGDIWVLSAYEGRLRFGKQVERSLQFWRSGLDGWFRSPYDSESRLVLIGIEANAYQKAQLDQLVDEEPTIRAVPVTTLDDKMARAQKLTPLAERRKIHVVKGCHIVSDQLVAFPTGRKDLFDALDIAITVAYSSRRTGRRTSRRNPLGLI